MSIEFRCPSKSTDSSGMLTFCNQLLKADSQFVGKQVKCPKCQQLTTIPAQSNAQPYSDGAPVSATPDSASPQLKVGRFDPFVQCPECGGMLDKEKRCTKCKYSQRKTKSDDLPLEDMEVKTTGFLLFVRKKLAKDLHPAAITAVVFIMLFLICFICLSVSFCAIGWWGLIVVPVLMVFVVASAIVYMKIRELCKVPGAELAFWQKPLWDLVLSVVRGNDWNSKYISKDTKVVDLRAEPPTDQDLFMLPDLSRCQVLDLEGSSISDAGLVALRSLPNLKYVVLKDTNVTNEGVFRFQQSVPEAWIWH